MQIGEALAIKSWLLICSELKADASSLAWPCQEPCFVVLHHHVFGSSKHIVEGIDGVMIDDRIVPAALAAFCNISVAGAIMVDGVECAVLLCDGPWPVARGRHCGAEREMGVLRFN